MKARNDAAMAAVVLFDLDGTLVDSAPDLVEAVNRVAADLGRAPVAIEQVRPAVSKGARAMLSAAFGDLSADAREQLVDPFLAHYGRALSVHSTAFPGVIEVLAAIEAAGTRWGIVTNKAQGLAAGVVAGQGWSRRCAVLVGGDALPRRKPDPDTLLLACEQLGCDPGSAVYVGDDERDIVAARAAGMRSVAALWGYRGAHEDPACWGADALAAVPVELIERGLLTART